MRDCDLNSELFKLALRNESIEALQRIPKSDLHNHAGRGGSQSYIGKAVNAHIAPPTKPFCSLKEMNQWLDDHVKCHCPPGREGYLKRIEAAFVQAQEDSIDVLALSYGVDEVFAFGEANRFIHIMSALHKRFAPSVTLLPDLTVGYDVFELNRLDDILALDWFRGIDIINYDHAYTMPMLQNLCRRARGAGLVLKAHVGEVDGADAVLQYARALELDQIQHGIAAATSPAVMKWLADHRVQLNICPTSNIMLQKAKCFQEHPIRALYDAGIPVTINTDDMLIFNASVSQEYLNLYNAGLMTVDELDSIRLTGLKALAK